MSELVKKYGDLMRQDPEKAIKVLIKDGLMSCSLPMWEEAFYHYQSNLHKGNSQAIKIASDNTGYSESMIYHIVSKFK